MVLNRKALRAQMVAQRVAMPVVEWVVASAQLSANLEAHLAQRGLPKFGQTLAFCWPIHNEPDIRPLVERWRASGIVVALPVVIAPDQPLVFRTWLPEEALLPDRYGIPTPTNGPLVTPDILLLPGNAFDDAGYRLGYGGGYFDRTLAQLSPRPIVIGLCFQQARVRTLQPELHDLPVDAVVTEKT